MKYSVFVPFAVHTSTINLCTLGDVFKDSVFGSYSIVTVRVDGSPNLITNDRKPEYRVCEEKT